MRSRQKHATPITLSSLVTVPHPQRTNFFLSSALCCHKSKMTAIVFTRKVLRLLAVPFLSSEVHWASLKLSDNKNKNKTDVIAPHRTQGVRRTKVGTAEKAREFDLCIALATQQYN